MVNLAVAQHGSIETWDWKATWTIKEKDDFIKKYLLPQLNVVKFCSAEKSETGCFIQDSYKRITGGNWTPLDKVAYPRAVLADGSAIQFGIDATCNPKTRCLSLRVDVNGAKKPNLLGADAHVFAFYPQTGEFLPTGVYKDNSYDETTKAFERYEEDPCEADGTCILRIIQDGYKITYDW